MDSLPFSVPLSIRCRQHLASNWLLKQTIIQETLMDEVETKALKEWKLNSETNLPWFEDDIFSIHNAQARYKLKFQPPNTSQVIRWYRGRRCYSVFGRFFWKKSIAVLSTFNLTSFQFKEQTWTYCNCILVYKEIVVNWDLDGGNAGSDVAEKWDKNRRKLEMKAHFGTFCQ